MPPTNTRPRLQAIVAGLLLAALLIAAFGRSAADTPARPGFTVIWRHPVPALRSMDISPQGVRLALLTADGRLAVWDAASAKPLWSKTGITGTDVKISDGVGYAFVYDPMNVEDTDIEFYDSATGRLVAKNRADGAIWDLAVSDTGDFMAVGTGNSSLYVYTLDVYPSAHRIPLRGICNALDFAPDGSFVAAGLWNASGIDCYDTTGKLETRIKGLITRRFEPVITRNSQSLLAIQYSNHQMRDPILTLWRRDGTRVWTHTLGKNAANVRAFASPSGDFTVASYYKDIIRDKTWAPERSLIVLDDSGRQVYEIGGMYLTLTLVCLSPDNNGFIAYDGDRKLYRFGRNGDALGEWDLSAPIRLWAVTRDDTQLLIHTVDNELTLLQVN